MLRDLCALFPYCYVFVGRAGRVQNEIFAFPLLVTTRGIFFTFLTVWPWPCTRDNAVKISSIMGTMNIRNTRRVPTIRLNTRLDYLRLASYLQVRSAEKCRMVVLSSGMLTLVPRYRKLAEPSDHLHDLDRLSVQSLCCG